MYTQCMLNSKSYRFDILSSTSFSRDIYNRINWCNRQSAIGNWQSQRQNFIVYTHGLPLLTFRSFYFNGRSSTSVWRTSCHWFCCMMQHWMEASSNTWKYSRTRCIEAEVGQLQIQEERGEQHAETGGGAPKTDRSKKTGRLSPNRWRHTRSRWRLWSNYVTRCGRHLQRHDVATTQLNCWAVLL